MPALIEAGAEFIGGCCGTTPDFIRALASKKMGSHLHFEIHPEPASKPR